MHDEQRITIEKVVERVLACDTPEEVKAYAKTLPEKQRWILRCTSPEKCRFLQNPDGSFKEYGGIHGENAVTIPFSDKEEPAETPDAIAAYNELFDIISSELVKAKQMGKVPHFYIGETHVDRGSSLYNLMALDIAKDLGFHQISIENELEDRVLSNEKRRPGLYNWGQIADADGKIPDTHPEAFAIGGYVQNRQVFIPHAIKLFGKGVFPTDLHIPDEEWSEEAVLDKREKYVLEQIRQNTDGKSPVMHFGGCDHSWGLKRFTDKEKIHPVSIPIRQAAYLTPPNLENFPDTYRIERTAEADYRPLLHGQVIDIEHSRTLAREAHKAVGAKLAVEFFAKHPELRPGNRVMTATGMQGAALGRNSVQGLEPSPQGKRFCR